MKSIVICCAVAICLEFVASIPHSTYSQRYSGLNAEHAPAPSYQYPQRPLYSDQQYNNGVYRAPIQLLQEQQLPRVEQSRDYHFSQNQQNYQPKGPPQQAEIFNGVYVNQQNLVNDYTNRHVQEIRHNGPQYAVPPLPPTITNTKPFLPAIPAIPAIPSVPQSSNSLFQQGVQELQLPIIQPAPEIQYPSVRAVSDVDRLMARAANPLPEPTIPQRPSIESILSHPKVRDVLATAEKKTRYLVIHTDGRVEHVNSIENVARKHPNYVLVNAGEIPNYRRTKPVTAVPPSQLTSPELTPTKEIIVEKHENISTVPAEAATISTPLATKADVQKEVILPVKPIEEQNEKPAVVKETTVQVPLVNDPITVTAKVLSPSIPSVATTAQTLEIHPSNITTVKEVIIPNDEKNVTNIAKSETISAVAETVVSPTTILPTPPAGSESQPSLGDLTNKIVQENMKNISNAIVNLGSPNNKSAPLADFENYIKGLSAVADVLAQEAPHNNSAATFDDNSATAELLDNKQKANKDFPEPLDSSKKVISNLSGNVPNEKPLPSPQKVEEVPNFGNLDISKVHAKPSVWFNTSDPELWGKLANNDKELDVVYFFHIHNQPKIEKDIKTTIHPNGTVVEDTIHTVWAFEGDEPTITKTTKVIHP